MYATTFDVSKFYLNNINLIMYINIKKIENMYLKYFTIFAVFLINLGWVSIRADFQKH